MTWQYAQASTKLGPEYNSHILERFVKNVAPSLGWNPNIEGPVRDKQSELILSHQHCGGSDFSRSMTTGFRSLVRLQACSFWPSNLTDFGQA